MSEKQKKPDIDQELAELALGTRNWARRIGAYVAEKDPTHHGYFTVEEWCDEFEQSPFMWKRVKRKLIQMAEPLTFDEFGGHYLGLPGSQAKSVVAALKYIRTMIETVQDHLEAMQTTGQWDDCRLFLEDGLSASRYNLNITDIPRLMTGMGMKVKNDFEQRLLNEPKKS